MPSRATGAPGRGARPRTRCGVCWLSCPVVSSCAALLEPTTPLSGATPSSRRRGAAELREVSEHGATERTWLLREQELTIGRDPASAKLVFNRTDVSRVHARLFAGPEGWWCEDAGSKNGTFVNGRRLVSPVRLWTGDTIRLGELALAFEDQDRPAPDSLLPTPLAVLPAWPAMALEPRGRAQNAALAIEVVLRFCLALAMSELVHLGHSARVVAHLRTMRSGPISMGGVAQLAWHLIDELRGDRGRVAEALRGIARLRTRVDAFIPARNETAHRPPKATEEYADDAERGVALLGDLLTVFDRERDWLLVFTRPDGTCVTAAGPRPSFQAASRSWGDASPWGYLVWGDQARCLAPTFFLATTGTQDEVFMNPSLTLGPPGAAVDGTSLITTGQKARQRVPAVEPLVTLWKALSGAG